VLASAVYLPKALPTASSAGDFRSHSYTTMLALAKLPPRWKEPCHARNYSSRAVSPKSSSGQFQPSRPPKLAGWQPEGKRLAYPADEIFPPGLVPGVPRVKLHYLSLVSRNASLIPALQQLSLAYSLTCGFDAWSFCRPGSIRCEWAFSESLQHDDTRTMRKRFPDHRVTY
jgi:hypothetical protein